MNRLREWREKKGVSQRDLAELTGLTQQAISYLELGDRDGKIGTWKKICDALDLELSQLLPRLWDKP